MFVVVMLTLNLKKKVPTAPILLSWQKICICVRSSLFLSSSNILCVGHGVIDDNIVSTYLSGFHTKYE